MRGNYSTLRGAPCPMIQAELQDRCSTEADPLPAALHRGCGQEHQESAAPGWTGCRADAEEGA